MWGSGTLGKSQTCFFQNQRLDNPRENADMSNEKGNLFPRLKLMVFN